MATLVRDKKKLRKKEISSRLNVFSKKIVEKLPETDPVSMVEKKDVESERKSKIVTAKITDQPKQIIKKRPRPSGVKGLKGSELDKYIRASTNDVIDLGNEAVVSFNTKSFKYMDYFQSLRKAILMVWIYPEDAIVNGYYGKIMLRFTVKRDGTLDSIGVVKSTGYKSLDEEAKFAIEAASPYSKFPLDLDKEKLHIVATFNYQPTFNVLE